ncbi:major capsid protein [Methylomagnum sp.]
MTGITLRSKNQMNPSQARVIDPILTEVAVGYSNPDRVGSVLFPEVPIGQRGGRVIKFGKEAFRKFSARRAPGGKTKRVQYGYTSDPIALVQDSLEGMVPYELMEEAEAVPGIDLGNMAVGQVMNSITLLKEIEQAELALNASNYDNNHKVALTGSDKWTHADSDPGQQMDDYKEAIRSSIGVYPNTLTLSPVAIKALRRNKVIRDQFKYTNASVITLDMLKAYFELENIVVGKAVYVDENAADDADPSDVWGNNAVLAYVAPPASRSQGEPSFGYTYELRGYPNVETPYEERSEKSWIYPVTHERRPYLTGALAGFLIQNPA